MNKKKVLIADDESTIRLLTFSILSKDYIVLEASDGQEAINIARNQKPDLILMDIMMPGIDGYTALDTIKKGEETKEIPVIMLTGVGYELNKKLSLGMGADGYITKPFNPQDLFHMVRQFLAVHGTGD